ncbi:hypothetical protein F2Q70_00026003 [Brassica cretica]|uniref:Uncharacterized protein n=1 Tax=Brassica cretica TaxID=69181 RepID=A0A8S9L976_BRACR|nr:hypothetical protein F2Q70_00026003 [Brassica cretica]
MLYLPIIERKRSHLVPPRIPKLRESLDEEEDWVSSRSGSGKLGHVHVYAVYLEGFVLYAVLAYDS